jgi:hypothetical protein
MPRVLLTLALVAAALAVVQAAPARTATPSRSLHVVSLSDFRIGARRFLGRTPIQITSAFGKPDARIAARSTLDLRYGSWTIHFERRTSDGRLLASSARSVDQRLYGSRGRRLLAPWFGLRGIEGAVTSELGWVKDDVWTEWIPQGGGYNSADYPRRISWGIDARGRRWLRLATTLDAEFRTA